MINKTYKIILASQSPRRKQLLEQAGFDIIVKPVGIEETYPAEMPAKEVAAFLANKKAEAARALLQKGVIVLAADSIVVLDEVIYEKPADKEDAKRILRNLSGNIHQVYTGVCLLSEDHKEVFTGLSDVSMDTFTEEEMDYYIDTCQPFDKAGAYGIQEWAGLCKVSKIEGTYANVMGLPINLVYQHLEKF